MGLEDGEEQSELGRTGSELLIDHQTWKETLHILQLQSLAYNFCNIHKGRLSTYFFFKLPPFKIFQKFNLKRNHSDA